MNLYFDYRIEIELQFRLSSNETKTIANEIEIAEHDDR